MTRKVKIIIIVLSVMLIAVAVALAVPLGIYVGRAEAGQTKINGVYEKSYYEVLDSLNNAETKLSKVNVVSGAKVKRELLADVWKECDVAVTNFSQLGMDGEEMETITKFLNQVGDYAYYLMGKTGAGEELSVDEKNNVKRFYELIGQLRSDLSAVGDAMVTGDRISADTLSDMTAVKDAIKNYSSIDYPELIYDGPFSDGLNDREAKFLEGKTEITEEGAVEKIKQIFPDATEIKTDGESKATIEAYVISFKNDGTAYNAFVTKKGGYIAALNGYGTTDNPQKTEEECVDEAKNFLSSIGYTDMSEVWVYNNNSTVYINFAYTDNGIVFYPDLIKVKVSSETGKVLGVEATNYIYNHGTRDVDYDNAAEGAISISGELTVTGTRYCVIPTDWNEEVYCKEVTGTSEGLTYYLYFDLSTGEEIRAMVVIDEDGNKLI